MKIYYKAIRNCGVSTIIAISKKNANSETVLHLYGNLIHAVEKDKKDWQVACDQNSQNSCEW